MRGKVTLANRRRKLLPSGLSSLVLNPPGLTGLGRGCSQLRARGRRRRAQLCTEGKEKKKNKPNSGKAQPRGCARQAGDGKRPAAPRTAAPLPLEAYARSLPEKEEKRRKARSHFKKKFPQTAMPPPLVCLTPEKRRTSSCLPSNAGSNCAAESGLLCTAAGPEIVRSSAIKYLRFGSKFGTAVSKPGREV